MFLSNMKFLQASSWCLTAHDYSSLNFIIFFLTFTPFFLFQVNLLTKILKSFSSSVSLGCCVCSLCVCIFVHHCFYSVYYCNCVT